jgi:hypothetical protein
MMKTEKMNLAIQIKIVPSKGKSWCVPVRGERVQGKGKGG